jgi:hypothetical protein
MPDPLNSACGSKGGLYCDGAGECVGCTASEQCTSGECTDPTCVNEMCGTAPTAAGAKCSTGYCKGNGSCVECVADANCTLSASEVCTSDVCVLSCPDNAKNGAETGKDCGGVACPPCPDLEGCAGPVDCVSGVCVGGVCQPPKCDDNVENGEETDLDCGGPTARSALWATSARRVRTARAWCASCWSARRRRAPT